MEKHPLAFAYSKLLDELLNSNKKFINPKIFKETIGELNPLFKGMHPADAKDLFFFLIEKLHQELNVTLENGNNQKINFYQQEQDSLNENKVLENFFNDFKLKNNSILSNIFYGVMSSSMKCNGCNKTKYSFQTLIIII